MVYAVRKRLTRSALNLRKLLSVVRVNLFIPALWSSLSDFRNPLETRGTLRLRTRIYPLGTHPSYPYGSRVNVSFHRAMEADMDEDAVMMGGANGTQFTQTLLLFVSPFPPHCFARIQELMHHPQTVPDAKRDEIHTAPDAVLRVLRSARPIQAGCAGA